MTVRTDAGPRNARTSVKRPVEDATCTRAVGRRTPRTKHADFEKQCAETSLTAASSCLEEEEELLGSYDVIVG